MGGEPFLRKDWGSIVQRLNERRINVGLISNGYLFDAALADKVHSLGVYQVGISLDAANAEIHDLVRQRPGSFRRATDAVLILNELDFPLRTVFTCVSRANIDELEGIRDWLLDNTQGFGWGILIANPHNLERMGKDNVIDADDYMRVAEFIDENRRTVKGRLQMAHCHGMGYFSTRLPGFAEWHGCPSGITNLGITSDGDVTGCLILADRVVEGNVRQESLVDIWRDPDRFEINRHFDLSLLEGDCRECPHREPCQGGCRDTAMSFSGSFYRQPFCLYQQERRQEGD